MKLRIEQFYNIILLLALSVLTCGSSISMMQESPFYSRSISFEKTLEASSKLYQKYLTNKGPAFIISKEVEAISPVLLNGSLYAKDKIHLRTYHTGGFEYIFRKQIMIPSMSSRWGDPLLISNKGETNIASLEPILFCDNTTGVEKWEYEEVTDKQGPVMIGAGKKAKSLFSGVSSKYFWKSEISYLIKNQSQQFSALVAPVEGSSIFMALNEDMHLFLDHLKHDFPVEFEIWLGNDGLEMDKLHWLENSNITEKWLVYKDEKLALEAGEWLVNFDFEAIELAYGDYSKELKVELSEDFHFLQEISTQKEELLASNKQGSNLLADVEKAQKAKRNILLANPLLDFDRILAVRRHKIPGKVRPIGQGPDPAGQASNYQSLSMVNRNIWDNSVVSLPVSGSGGMELLFKPDGNRYVGKIDLHFGAERFLFSQPNEEMTYQVFEMDLNSGKVRQVSPDDGRDVDNYDACYLPSEEIIFASTACYHGVPCVNGNSNVANLCRMNADGSEMRMLCFDQDDNWHPTVLNNGKILYTRWEYTDSPHFFTRLLMSMNPDGTNQRAYYGSNSYWPNSIFFAKPVPNDPGKVVGVVSGHHGTRRAGELYLFDPAKGRHEADGVVQQIPGRNKEVIPVISDRLVDESWPKFLNPHPLSDKYFLVSAQITPFDNWAIYLVDVHDNLTMISEDPFYHLLEPIPMKSKPTPPIIPDRIDPKSTTATVYLQDIYLGPGLKGIPVGRVKSLRLFEWHYAYRGTGGHTHVGIDGPWEPRRILGTVPVYEDGSAHFYVPANTPIAIQPLDEEGRALQIMRSWFTAMPGERLSCVGCHEDANQVPPARPTLAARKAAVNITEWKGPERGFSFKREIQPVLDTYCVRCHNGSEKIPDFRLKEDVTPLRNNTYLFTSSYSALHPYVRRPGPENDYHLTNPMEYHADQTELVQLLKKGHHNVVLSKDAWERIYVWIDLNVPDHGSWMDHTNKIEPYIERRMELRERYAGLQHNPEVFPDVPASEEELQTVQYSTPPRQAEIPILSNWPMEQKEAIRIQKDGESSKKIRIKLSDDVDMEFARIPQGEFIMGQNNGPQDEYPAHKAIVDNPFYMSVHETSLAQYLEFNPDHQQGVINWTNKDQGAIGYPLDNPDIPVIRVSWQEAIKYCQWLSERTGYEVTLPSEIEWEWACRAGTDTDLYFGNADTDFGKYANLADNELSKWARRESPQWQPRVKTVNDGHMLFNEVGAYEPNAWGLYDMHGNAAEWTSSSFTGYPGNPNLLYANPEKIVARGGSWYDRPYRARSGYRMDFEKYQKVYNVGFRVILRKK